MFDVDVDVLPMEVSPLRILAHRKKLYYCWRRCGMRGCSSWVVIYHINYLGIEPLAHRVSTL